MPVPGLPVNSLLGIVGLPLGPELVSNNVADILKISQSLLESIHRRAT
jgi:hypothetical protein